MILISACPLPITPKVTQPYTPPAPQPIISIIKK